jgi:cytochrome c2
MGWNAAAISDLSFAIQRRSAMLLRVSAILGLLACALLAASALPWAAGNGGSAAAEPGEAAYGLALFNAKGCASCHQHAAVAGSGQFSGGPAGTAPVLTNYPGDPAYLRAWLRDPKAIKPATGMPTLGLSEPEIDALVAFLKAGAASTR